jgi:hypothetical protein
MKNCFLSSNHHPSTHPVWVAGQVLVNSASPDSVRTDRPAGDHDRASVASPSICRLSGTTVPGSSRPSRADKRGLFPDLSLPLERSHIPRLAGFVLPWPKDLEGRKNQQLQSEREKVLLRRLPLHCLPFFSTELFVAHPLSSPPPPPAAPGCLPCVQSSLRSRLWSRAIF